MDLESVHGSMYSGHVPDDGTRAAVIVPLFKGKGTIIIIIFFLFITEE